MPAGDKDAARTQPILGRHAETALLRSLLIDAEAGSGATVLVAGPGGIGKTSILRWLEGTANDHRLRVRRGYCLAEIQEPFFPMEQLFSPGGGAELRTSVRRARSRMEAIPQAFMPRSATGAVSEALPAALVPLGSRSDEEQSPADRAPANVLLDYLSKIEEDSLASPCVLILDDFHWADPDSVQALQFLSRNISRMPVLMAVALREDEVQSSALRIVLSNMRREGLTKDISLKGLDEKDSLQLLENAVRAPLEAARAHDAVRFLLEQTGGNPYFFLELVRMWQEDGLIRVEGGKVVIDDRLSRGYKGVGIKVPDSVLDLLTQRLRSLTRVDREVLEGAAILGQEFEVAPLDELFPSRGEGVGKALDRLAAKKGLVVHKDEGGTRYGFAQALLWEAVRGSIPEERRKQWTGQLAKWLELHIPADLERISTLYQWGGLNKQALQYVDRIIEMSLQMHAHERAIMNFETRIGLMEHEGASAEEMAKWGLSVVDRLRKDGGDDHWVASSCRRLLQASPPEPLSWELVVRLADATTVNLLQEARQLLDKVKVAATQRPELASPALSGMIAVVDSRVLYSEGKSDASAEVARAALSILPEGELFSRGLAYYGLGWFEMDRNRWEEATRALEKGLAAAGEGKVDGLIPHLLNLKGSIAMVKGDLRVSEKCSMEASAICRGLGNVVTLSVVQCNLSVTRQEMGDIDGAEEAAREALRLAQVFNQAYLQGSTSQTLGEVLVLRKSASEAMDLFSKAKRVYGETGNSELIQEVDMDIAEVKGIMGDAPGALDTLKKVMEQGQLKQDQTAHFHMVRFRLMLAMGDKDESRADVELALEESRKRGLRYWEGRALLGLSDWEKAFGTPESADKMRQEAENVLKGCGVVNISLFQSSTSRPVEK
jgi:tetratricopeptide (TPR) repeat protein